MFNKQIGKLMTSLQRFNSEEKRFLICLLSKIDPADEDFKAYRILFNEYASFIDRDADYVRNTLPKVTKGIMAQMLEFENSEKTIQRAVIAEATYFKGYEFVEVRMHPDLRAVFIAFKERFTQYKLENALCMRNKYAVRLYEIIIVHDLKKHKGFRLSWDGIPIELRHEYPEIQKLLDTNYTQFADFEKRVLKPVQAEMKQYTELCFEYKKVKLGRFVSAIDFLIKSNVPKKAHGETSLFDILSSMENVNDKTILEIAQEAEKAIDNMKKRQI